MFVFRLMLPERRMAFEQFVQHATEAEPIGAGIVGRAFRQYFGRHVTVRSPAIQ